ncbi:MAG: type III-A CRISPR-associated protein Cas10/Csm1 [candidate division KSB1 bacterium]|nr:type III-A CRISPR-associated protein Cas10/Csm1 [candidate division KSB1 bacterium]
MTDKETIILAALLHDIGKLSQRYLSEMKMKHEQLTEAFFRSSRPYWGERADELIRLTLHHHQTGNDPAALIVQLADWLAAGEREKEERDQLSPHLSALTAAVSRVRLENDQVEEKYHQLQKLELADTVFPIDQPQLAEGSYVDLWNEFMQSLQKITTGRTYQSADLTTLFYLLKVYTSFMPGATPWEKDELRTIPDVSLFDHSRMTAAIAACLVDLDWSANLFADILNNLRSYTPPESKPCLLLRGDLSGIQAWIYRITRGDETKGTAKRLRGRSFYLSLLNQTLAEWFRRRFDLPITNILYCGGGNFDLLLPNTEDVRQRLVEYEEMLQEYLLNTYSGEIGLVTAWVEIAVADFVQSERFATVYRKIDDRLSEKKLQKYLPLLAKKPQVFTIDAMQELCPICGIHPAVLQGNQRKPCRDCETHKEIGGWIPRVNDGYLIFTYGSQPLAGFNAIDFDLPEERSTAYLLDEKQYAAFVRDAEGELFVLSLNKPGKFEIPLTNISYGFQFLGGAAPIVQKSVRQSEQELVFHRDEMLEFEEIASLGEGADYLGVLKMDVDRLGLLFSAGFDRPTISRLAALSSQFDFFFAGWLNEICREQTRTWESSLEENDPRRGLLESLFYLVYSGGDDLLVIGPWEQTLHLALRIRNEFQRFAGGNPNLHLSAGIVLVKPNYPIQRFAELADRALHQAKETEVKGRTRNHVSIFGKVLEWDEFADLIDFGIRLAEAVRSRSVPRSIVYLLHRLHLQHFRNGRENPMWIPKAYYALSRRIRKEVLEDERLNLIESVRQAMKAMIVPASYAGLKNREKRK